MLAVDEYGLPFVNLPEPTLLEIHRSKISLHHAKDGYSYPTIRLPHTFSRLAGLPTQIYQTVHDGALAFLVVVSSGAADTKKSAKKSENAKTSVRTPALTWLRGSRRRCSFIFASDA